MMPAMMQQLSNPAVQGLVSNPEALAAINQIQQGLQRLQQAAPEVYSSMNMPSLGPGLNLASTPGANPTAATTTGGTKIVLPISNPVHFPKPIESQFRIFPI